MANFKLYSPTGEYLRSLDVIQDKMTEELNKLDELELTYTGKDPDLFDRVIIKDKQGIYREFIIMEINASRSQVMNKTLYCVDSFVECMSDYVDDRRFREATALSALEGILSTSRWRAGQVSIDKLANFNIYHSNPYDALKELVKTYECEFQTRIEVTGKKIEARYIDLSKAFGSERGKRFEYAKDLMEVSRTYEPNMIYTAMYGYGKGGNSQAGENPRRVDFADINNGKKYVEDVSAIPHFGRPTDEGTRQHSYGVVIFDNVEDKAELLKLTQEHFKKQLIPKISYKAKVVDLSAYGYDFEAADLGDSVLVVDKSFEPELRIKARITKIVSSHLDKSVKTVEIGSYTPVLSNALTETAKAISTINSRSQAWDQAASAFDSNGKLNANYITHLFEKINDLFLSANTYIQFDEKRGMLFFNNKDESKATWAMQLSSAGWRIANSRAANGDWNWKSAATGSGITADVINAGVIRGGATTFDLNNGKIRVDVGEPSDKTTLEISPDVGFRISNNNSPVAGIFKSSDDGKFVMNANRISNVTSGQVYLEVGGIMDATLEGKLYKLLLGMRFRSFDKTVFMINPIGKDPFGYSGGFIMSDEWANPRLESSYTYTALYGSYKDTTSVELSQYDVNCRVKEYSYDPASGFHDQGRYKDVLIGLLDAQVEYVDKIATDASALAHAQKDLNDKRYDQLIDYINDLQQQINMIN